MPVKRVSEATCRCCVYNLSNRLVSEEGVSWEDRTGFVDSFRALDSQLSLHTNQLIEISEGDGEDLLEDVRMFVFGEEDFFVGYFELGLELFVVQRLVDPMVVLHQPYQGILTLFGFDDSIYLVEVGQFVVHVAVLIELLISYFLN